MNEHEDNIGDYEGDGDRGGYVLNITAAMVTIAAIKIQIKLTWC